MIVLAFGVLLIASLSDKVIIFQKHVPGELIGKEVMLSVLIVIIIISIGVRMVNEKNVR